MILHLHLQHLSVGRLQHPELPAFLEEVTKCD